MLQLFELYKIDKPIRLIELFAGYGSQALALKNIGADFEHYKVVEFDKYAVKTYNALHDTNFEVQDITQMHDFNIVDKDKYDYIMTYSFPCTDLSLAGKQGGMGKGTRSGLLWEVERLLKENELPQVLIMENVTQLHGTKFKEDFIRWIQFLAKLGYSNQWQDLNAKHYGIPQNRDRTFMVSILGDYEYHFPTPIELKTRLKDYLEDVVDEKYYLSDKMIQGMKNTKFNSYSYDSKVQDKNGISSTILSRFEGAPQCVETEKTMCLNSKVNGVQPSLQDRVYDINVLSTAITTSFMPSIAMPEATKKGFVEALEGDGVYINRPHQKRGVVQRGMIQTLKTSGDDLGVVVNPLKSKTNYGWHFEQQVYDENGITRTIKAGEGSGNTPKVIVKPKIEYENPLERLGWHNKAKEVLNTNGISTCIHTQSNNLLQKIKEKNSLRIRKLTPKECFRLMGLKDYQIDKIINVNSNSQLYKQAGNSIVVNVLEAIFKEMI